jgi:hypothetical protein
MWSSRPRPRGIIDLLIPSLRAKRSNLHLCLILPLLLTLLLLGCHGDPLITEGDREPVHVGGVIASDTTWQAQDGPYLVTGDITVSRNMTWSVETGTEISVAWNKTILIHGKIYWSGSINQPIVLTSQLGVWKGIKITGFISIASGSGTYQSSSVMGAVDIYNAINAVHCVDSGGVTMSYCRIINCDSIGIIADSGADISIGQCDFVNDRTLNLFNPTAIWSKPQSRIWVHSTQINGFHHGIRIQGFGYLSSLQSIQLISCDVGIICDTQDTLEIFEIEFRGCQTGILITQGSPTILYNAFEKQGECIRVEGFCAPEAHYNSFTGSQTWAWVHFSPYDADATNNWWGTADPDSIAALIYDHQDDPSSGTVHFEPFLTSEP